MPQLVRFQLSPSWRACAGCAARSEAVSAERLQGSTPWLSEYALEVFVVACRLAMPEERVRLSSSAPLRASPSGRAPGFHPGLREFNSPCALYRGVGHRMCRCIRDADQAGSTPVSSTAGWVAQMVEAAASGAVC